MIGFSTRPTTAAMNSITYSSARPTVVSADLTPGDALKASFFKWSADGASFFVLSTERDQQNFDLYRYAAADYERELLYENTGFDIADLSPDGRWLALDKPRTSADSDIYLVDLGAEPQTPVLITAHDGNIAHLTYGFTPDSRYLVYGTDEYGEFSQAWRHDLQNGTRSPLIGGALGCQLRRLLAVRPPTGCPRSTRMRQPNSRSTTRTPAATWTCRPCRKAIRAVCVSPPTRRRSPLS